jgi:hypothetical protein
LKRCCYLSVELSPPRGDLVEAPVYTKVEFTQSK